MPVTFSLVAVAVDLEARERHRRRAGRRTTLGHVVERRDEAEHLAVGLDAFADREDVADRRCAWWRRRRCRD